MEKSQNEDIKMLIDVLSQGNDYIMELEAHLYNYQTFSSKACLLLSSKLQSTFAAAINMTKLIKQRSLQSPPSATDSLQSESSERREIYKKRKTLPSWSQQVKACSASAMEMPVDDGYSWRKYGQKDILGAKFPRCYYRCTHRHSRNCVATKQVQRSEENYAFFDITYRGAHTCNNGLPKALLSTNEQSIHQKQSLKVKTEALMSNSNDLQLESSPSPSFSLASLKPESNVFCSASNTENYYVDLDSEIADIIFASASTTSSQMLGMDFGVEQLVFDSEFPFDFC